MRTICIIERYLFCIKNVKLSHFHDVIEKELFESYSKENYFVVSKMTNFLIIVLFKRKLKNLVLFYFILNFFFPKRV